MVTLWPKVVTEETEESETYLIGTYGKLTGQDSDDCGKAERGVRENERL